MTVSCRRQGLGGKATNISLLFLMRGNYLKSGKDRLISSVKGNVYYYHSDELLAISDVKTITRKNSNIIIF